MRITLEMGDEDILVLAALSDYKPPTVEAGIKNISDFKVAGIQSENLESVLSKLQCYGLIAYIPEGITGISTADYPFRVLPRGRKFLAATDFGLHSGASPKANEKGIEQHQYKVEHRRERLPALGRKSNN